MLGSAIKSDQVKVAGEAKPTLEIAILQYSSGVLTIGTGNPWSGIDQEGHAHALLLVLEIFLTLA